MKKILFVLLLISCSEQKKESLDTKDSIINTSKSKSSPGPSQIISSPAGGNDKALEALKSEPKIKDVLITDANVLYASVIDDGTNRDGYAEYVCQVLSDYSTSVKKVKIIKFNSSNDPDRDNAYGVLLGEATCR